MNLNKTLIARCSSCKKDITIKSNATTRPDLQMEKGDEFTVNCQNCGKMEKKHVNDIKVQPNNMPILIGFGIGVIATLILWHIFGGISLLLSAAIPIGFWYHQMDATKAFNSYTIRRK